MENRYEVKVYQIDYVCDECGEGNMVSTGYGFRQIHTTWGHKCTNSECNARKDFVNKQYPLIRYEPAQ